MAVAAASVWEVRTAGNDTNGGGYVTGSTGVDYSQQDAKNTVGADISTTDAVAVGTAVITSVLGNFGTTIVGNIIYLQGGTGTLAAGWYQVISRASTTSITVDRNVAAGTGITMNIGGALASIGTLGMTGFVGTNRAYIKAGSYTISSATPNISGGCFSSSTSIFIEGYNATRGDMGTAPVLTASGISTFTVIIATGNLSSIVNIDINGASLTSSRGMTVRGYAFKCKVSNCNNSAFVPSSQFIVVRCTATGCATNSPFADSCYFIDCIAHDNTVTGFIIGAAFVAIRCISDTNTGASSDGFTCSSTVGQLINCIAYANGRDGFRLSTGAIVENCIAENNTGIGINGNNTNGNLLVNNATYNNTGGSISFGTGKANINLNAVAGSGSFFTNAASQDFSLNNTSGAGAAARAVGYPGILPIGGTGYIDIGVLQHQDPAGGSGGGLRLAGHGGLAS